jgi:hypothetical protein
MGLGIVAIVAAPPSGAATWTKLLPMVMAVRGIRTYLASWAPR